MKDRLVGGTFYFIIFIDDHYRKLWTFNLKSKNEISDVFEQFHTIVERETRGQLKCI